MTKLEYAKACTEVIAVLNNLSKEEYEKIPTKEIEYYKSNIDKYYDFKFGIINNNLSKEAKAIIITIFRDYFANDTQKKTLHQIVSKNDNNL